ncbi:MAG: hypothetical protein KJP00_00965 [Bacteroidia bacterium]|nr:hypothetical protein [Bacteroidia bacterium]
MGPENEFDDILGQFKIPQDSFSEELDCFYFNTCISISAAKSGQGDLSANIHEVRTWFLERPGTAQRFQSRFGNPYWDGARDFSKDDIRLVFIPILAQRSAKLQAILIVYFNEKGGLQFKIMDKRQLKSYRKRADIRNLSRELSYEFVLLQFILFDFDLTGAIDCSIVKLLKSKHNAKSCTYYVVEYWQDWDIYVGGQYSYSDPILVSVDYEWVCSDGDLLPGLSGESTNTSDLGGTGGGTTSIIQPLYGIPLLKKLTFLVNPYGILQVQGIPKIDMVKSSEKEVINQLLKVLNAVHQFFCETRTYYPIDLRDYFDNTTSINASSSYDGCPIHISLAHYRGRFIIDTQPSRTTRNTNYQIIWTFDWTDTTLPAISITTDETCEDRLYATIWGDC